MYYLQTNFELFRLIDYYLFYTSQLLVFEDCVFFLFFLFFFLYMAGLLQTGTISRYNTAESHSLMHYSQLCGTHQPRLCALELLPKEFTGGISDDPCRALHSDAARPRHTCAALITLLPNSLTWLGEPVAYSKDTCQRCRMEGSLYCH